MQKVFEKIIEKIKNVTHDNPMVTDNYILREEAIEIVKQTAAKYEKDNYFNLDEVTLHKCPVCGGVAEHRVKKTGCWACGCFKCKVFKTGHNHDKAIQAWEDFCAEYNNGWIPCSERLPEDGEPVLATDGNYVYLVEYDADLDASFGDMDGIVAWRPLPEPYKPKGE